MFINKYSGTCYRCGETVKAGDGIGHFIDFPGLIWHQLHGTRNLGVVEHPVCRKKYGGTDTHHIYKPDPADDDIVLIETDLPKG